MAMISRLKISHHKHSGRLRPHEYTSYFPLMTLLVIVGITLTICSTYAASPGPESGSVGLTGQMPGPPPTVAAVITSPPGQSRTSISPIAVKGTCPKNTLVQIFKNDIFAGSTACTPAGTFSVDVDLLMGQNILIARVYDDLDQPGPDSSPVTVFYDALPPQSAALSPLNFGAAQLLLNTDAVYRGVFPKKEMSIPIGILGGTPPYAVNIRWGDSENTVVPRNDNATFRTTHVYKKPGVYQITLQGTDSQSRVAFLTVAAIVNGQTSVEVAAPTTLSQNKLLAIWPLYTTIVAVVISFWLGEWREKRILRNHPYALS